MVSLPREGETSSLRYHYLQGLTEGFLKMDKHEYNTTRKTIIDFFQKR